MYKLYQHNNMERDMTLVYARHVALAEDLCSRATIPLTSGVALKVAHLVLIWNDRAKARTMLRNMEQHRLEDLGLTMDQVYLEARKPFWRS
jgi:uncharacterized protein YjiS (DUF1127 family)